MRQTACFKGFLGFYPHLAARLEGFCLIGAPDQVLERVIVLDHPLAKELEKGVFYAMKHAGQLRYNAPLFGCVLRLCSGSEAELALERRVSSQAKRHWMGAHWLIGLDD